MMEDGTILTATRPKWAAKSSDSMEYLYRCESKGAVNNGLKSSCTFEVELEEGPHHCPICGHELQLISSGLTVSEILRRGQREVDQQNKGTTK